MRSRIRYSAAAFFVASAVFIASSAAVAATEGSFDRTLSVNGGVNLEIETGSGSIQVRTGSSNEVRITGHIHPNNWLFGSPGDAVERLEQNPPIQQSGNDIRIGHISDPEIRRNVSVSYEVVAPANTKLHSSTGSGHQDISGVSGPVEANTGSGGVKVSDIGSGVRAQSGSGNIDIDNIKGSVYARAGSGSIRAVDIAGGFDGQTGSGHLSLEQTAPGSVHAETGSGGLDLHNVRGSLEARAGSGGIHADGEPTGEWILNTGSGGVELRFPHNASFDLNAHTGSGSINVSQPITVQGSMGKKEIHGKVGGGGVPVNVQTGSGSISIDYGRG